MTNINTQCCREVTGSPMSTELQKGGEWIHLEIHKTLTENILPQVTSYLSKLLPQNYNT